MKVIVISGKAQHGKDTTASFMKEVLESNGSKILITHYADLVKYICKTFFNWNGKKDIDGRNLLQYVGTDKVRNLYPNFWVDFISKMLTVFWGTWDYVIIPDCRFPNEINYLKGDGFDVTHVRVLRDGFESDLTEDQKHHISETILDHIKPDYLIHNNGSIDDLKDTVKRFVSDINEPYQMTIYDYIGENNNEK